MSPVGSWLAGREPAPPAPLREALRALLAEETAPAFGGGADGRELPAAEALTALARARLERAMARPGRARASAYRLLEADALFTYACEAALDEVDRQGSLRRILTVASRSR